MIVEVDGRLIFSSSDFCRQLFVGLGLNNSHGCNLDSLWDFLSGSVERPLVLVWKSHEESFLKMGGGHVGVIEVLDRVCRQDEEFGFSEKFSYVLK